jgi:methionyl-tRNA formyltransferase
MDLLFAASGEFALPSLQALLASGHHIICVYSQPDRPAGRGKHLTPTPVSQFALQNGLPLIRTASLNSERLPPADAMVVIAFAQKLDPTTAQHARLGSVNLHASLLPRWRGAAPINWAILAGDAVTGNSIIRIAPRMDTGNVLAQSTLAIGATETAGELHDRLAADGAALLSQTLGRLESDAITESPQDESRATVAPKLHRDAARIDWSQPADRVVRTIHGLYPWPGCRISVINSQVQPRARVTLVRACHHDAQGIPGHIDAAGLVGCGQGSLEILELQPDGKRPMSLAAFRNGHPWDAGSILEPLS